MPLDDTHQHSSADIMQADNPHTPISPSGSTTRASLGLATTDSPEFAALNVGAPTDTTLGRVSAGVLSVEGKTIYAADGTDVAVADGGTGASTAAGARTNLGLATLFNVRNYGATGDGATDDTTAVRAAIAASAAASGGVCFFPPGTYIVQPLTIPPGAVLQGVNGQGYYNATTTVPNVNTQSRLKLKAASASALISPDDSGANVATHVRIFDLALDCNGLTQPAINLPDSGSSISRFWIIERAYVVNVGGNTGYAVYIGNQNAACTMRDCIVFNGTSGSRAGHDGVGWYGSDGTMIDTFIGYFSGTGLTVVGGSSDTYLSVRGGGIFTCTDGVVVGGAGAVFVGVSIDHHFNQGVYAAFPASFIGCWFHTNSRQTNNQWSDLRLTGTGVIYGLVDCRFTPHSGETANVVRYHIEADADVILNQLGNHQAEAAATGFSNYAGTTTAPGFPNSTVAVTNSTGADITAFVANGAAAITAIVLGATTTGMTIAINGTGSIRIPQGQKVAFTYASGTPTWTWVIG